MKRLSLSLSLSLSHLDIHEDAFHPPGAAALPLLSLSLSLSHMFTSFNYGSLKTKFVIIRRYTKWMREGQQRKVMQECRERERERGAERGMGEGGEEELWVKSPEGLKSHQGSWHLLLFLVSGSRSERFSSPLSHQPSYFFYPCSWRGGHCFIRIFLSSFFSISPLSYALYPWTTSKNASRKWAKEGRKEGKKTATRLESLHVKFMACKEMRVEEEEEEEEEEERWIEEGKEGRRWERGERKGRQIFILDFLLN